MTKKETKKKLKELPKESLAEREEKGDVDEYAYLDDPLDKYLKSLEKPRS